VIVKASAFNHVVPHLGFVARMISSVARLEDALEEHDSFGSLFPYPIVLVEHQAFF
jgi:hypothetical protein